MTIFTVGQSEFVCNTMTERDSLFVSYPDIEPMTRCTVMAGAGGGLEAYRFQSGVWAKTYPNQQTIDWLAPNSADIAALQGNVGTINSAITALTTALSGKTDVATTTALQATVTALTATVAGQANIAWVPVVQTRSIVTGTGATGFRPSTITNTLGIYNINTQTTASIAGNADGYVVAEICATNSATPSDWIIVGKTRNAQALTLAITLQSVQNIAVPLVVPIPKGWYAKLRTVTTLGTYAASYDSGSETPMS